MIDAVLAEWLKFRSLRSNFYLLASSLLAVFLSAGVAFMVTRGFDNQTGADQLRFDNLGAGLGTGLPVAYFVLGALGALAMTAEHDTSLVAVPRRLVLLCAKVPTLLVVGLVAGEVLAFGMHVATQAVLGDRAGRVLLSGQTLGASLSEPGVLAEVALAGASVPLVALVGLGVGTVLRSTAGSLVVLIMLVFVLPTAAMTLPSPWGSRIGAYLIVGGGDLLPPLAAAAVLVAYPVVAMMAGAVAIVVRGRRARPLVAGLAATGVLVATVVVAQPAGAASAIDWKPCREDMECGSVQVPVDWDEPGGRKISLPVARLATTGTGRRIGTVFSIPGGPGASGVDDLEKSGGSFAHLRRRFDVVSFTPRNSPALEIFSSECLEKGPWLTLPRDERAYDQLGRANRAAALRCAARDPELFGHLDSASVARDIDAVRAALGEERLSFVATSYGGVPAYAYARLFPRRIRAMYLDGIVNQVGRNDRHTVMEAQFGRFVTWCASSTACALHGRDAGAAWRALLAAADRSPIPAREIAYSGFDLQIAAAPHLISPGADHARWKELSESIERAERGDASGFAGYVGAGIGSPKPMAFVGMNMTHCLDGYRFRDYADYRSVRKLGERLSPNLAGNVVWHRLGCVGWPLPVQNPAAPLPTAGLPPFLGAGTWTDYADTADLATRVPGSSTVRFEGHGHGLYLTGDACTIAHANRYLIDLRLPPRGTVCRPDRSQA
ncbi:alpha/beta fold hydrolase [Nonomuraea africana]|uniref:alpha/beta fold hydrolase n=1 Tax=Nonomuraea africana TaxID=46171 RepID=UPI0033C5E790